jgi:hypothetical protein
MLDAVEAPDLFDEPDGSLDGGRRVVLESEGESQEEERLGVGRALDLRVQRRVDGQHELALDLEEVADHAVVHPQPAAVAERMAVGLLYR